jgi:prepilin-type N-terminal cleavage/methylation domain-containing protein/prepilin-type processing-associated H-X9-DG protein
MSRRIKKNGFTVIELLSVIAVIAVLMAILIPAVEEVRASANRTKCASHLSQIAQASLLFTSENKMRLPLLTWGDPDAGIPTDYWFNLIKPYLDVSENGGFPQVFRCPSDNKYDAPPETVGWNAISYMQAPRVGLNPDNDQAPGLLIRVEDPPKTPMYFDAEVVSSIWLTNSNFEQQVRNNEPEWRHKTGINVVYWDGHVEFDEEPTYQTVFKLLE